MLLTRLFGYLNRKVLYCRFFYVFMNILYITKRNKNIIFLKAWAWSSCRQHWPLSRYSVPTLDKCSIPLEMAYGQSMERRIKNPSICLSYRNCWPLWMLIWGNLIAFEIRLYIGYRKEQINFWRFKTLQGRRTGDK